MVSSLNIIQDRLSRSRLAGDPPDISITPRLGHIGLLEFDRARDAIDVAFAAAEAARDLGSFEMARQANGTDQHREIRSPFTPLELQLAAEREEPHLGAATEAAGHE